VSIRGNIIKDCRAIAITVQARGGTGEVAPAGAHRDTTIAENSVIDSPMPNIEITSTVHASITDNTFSQSSTARPDRDESGHGPSPGEAIKTTNCDRITVRDNFTSK
jgi:hypothetical protein